MLLRFLFVLLPFSLKAQTDTVKYYFDAEFSRCEKELAVISGFGVMQDGKLKFRACNMETGKTILDGWFTDTTLTLRYGTFTYYDVNGKKETEGDYVVNVEQGYWIVWEDGRVTDSVLFEEGNRAESVTLSYHPNFQLSRRYFIGKKGRTEETEWYPDGTLKRDFKINSNVGVDNRYYPNGRLKSMEHVKMGKVEWGQYYKEDGTELTKAERKQKDNPSSTNGARQINSAPSYPGGQAAFASFFQRNFKVPKSLQTENISESVTVTFYLDKAGYAYDIKVTGATNREVEIEVKTVFQRMPAWLMNGFTNGFGPITQVINL